MDVSELLDELNDKQRDAVAAPLSNMLVLAGAGSGKTRVLVHRIAWLMQVENIAPYSILAVTFTNKAAREMRGRIEHVMGRPLNTMWIGTFHGLAHRLLRAHYAEANLPENFQILDSDDQYRLVRRVLKAMNLDEKHWAPRQIQWYINGNKDEGLRPQHIETHGDHTQQKMRDIYAAYQEACDRSGLVDFAELLLRAHELWVKNPDVLAHYQRRFRAVLVDEFQDTNNIQYAWLRLLCNQDNNIMIVGDDDQSIYGWRGANVDNIQHFLKDFDGASTIRLEQNYRSTATILKAANTVIDNNQGRLGKELWTDGDDGEPISIYAGFNDLDEARFIVAQISDWHNQGNQLKEVAILYRNNAQSRVLEEALLHQSLPYRIYGGLRFFERQEIKDALGYMRLVNHAHDDAAFERVVNTPSRGLGERTLATIREQTRVQDCSMWQASLQLLQDGSLKGRAANALNAFIELINKLADDFEGQPLEEQANKAINQSGLYAMYQAEKGEKAQARLENLEELVTACKQFVIPEEADEMTPLQAFLAHASLEAGETQASGDQDAVQLMTIHTAKGLEFPLVFIAGVEEGMFPSQMTNDEPGRMEEERRLCYVGMTRAMKKLYMTYAEMRRVYGQEKYHTASRFLREIPSECVEEIRLTSTVSRPVTSRFSNAASHERMEQSGFSLGQRVRHRKFGEGVVLNYEGSGDHARVQVNFDEFGSKWLVLSFAKLEVIQDALMQQKVLIIEDSASDISLLTKLVEMAQLMPVLATSLTAAKHIFIHSDPEDYLCAIVDYDLPDAANGEAIDFAVKSYLPTIVTTDRLDEDIRKAILARDVVDYIPKENAQIFDYLMRLIGRLEKNKTTGVLVINPNRRERAAMAALLRRHNFITYECASAAQAESRLDEHSHIKLVFVDSEIQDKPPTQFVAWLRKQYSKEDLGIIGIANDRNNLLSARFIKSGANDFVRKPYHLEEFLCRVNQNIELLENVETIRRTANTDYLTGLPNRRHFFYTVNKMQRNQPANQALALLDLDFFKAINDTHGHDAGDEVLKVVANRLAVLCADVIIARFGGEEFCLYLPDATPHEAVNRLEKIRRNISEHPAQFGELSLNVTVSIGLTTRSDHNIQAMLTTADKLLYQAKHEGRNRVVHDAPPGP